MIALVAIDVVSILLACTTTGLWYFERRARIDLEQRLETKTVVQIRKVAEHYMHEAQAARRDLADMAERLAKLERGTR